MGPIGQGFAGLLSARRAAVLRVTLGSKLNDVLSEKCRKRMLRTISKESNSLSVAEYVSSRSQR